MAAVNDLETYLLDTETGFQHQDVRDECTAPRVHPDAGNSSQCPTGMSPDRSRQPLIVTPFALSFDATGI